MKLILLAGLVYLVWRFRKGLARSFFGRPKTGQEVLAELKRDQTTPNQQYTGSGQPTRLTAKDAEEMRK